MPPAAVLVCAHAAPRWDIRRSGFCKESQRSFVNQTPIVSYWCGLSVSCSVGESITLKLAWRRPGRASQQVSTAAVVGAIGQRVHSESPNRGRPGRGGFLAMTDPNKATETAAETVRQIQRAFDAIRGNGYHLALEWCRDARRSARRTLCVFRRCRSVVSGHRDRSFRAIAIRAPERSDVVLGC